MESNEIRQQLLDAERAAAAPYLNHQKNLLWHYLALSCVLPLFCIVVHQLHPDRIGSPNIAAFLPTIFISIIVIAVVTDQRKRNGMQPSGQAPQEPKVVYWYFIIAVILGLATIPFSIFTPLPLSIPVAFIVNLLALWWFATAYERAAERTRTRLA